MKYKNEDINQYYCVDSDYSAISNNPVSNKAICNLANELENDETVIELERDLFNISIPNGGGYIAVSGSVTFRKRFLSIPKILIFPHKGSVNNVIPITHAGFKIYDVTYDGFKYLYCPSANYASDFTYEYLAIAK